MNIFENKEFSRSDDIAFLLDLCRDLIKLFKEINPNIDIPIEREQIVKLNRIAKRTQRLSYP
ncbi:MAG: hypothetical protein ACFFDB_12755 [Promethearchaeota archaeon]